MYQIFITKVAEKEIKKRNGNFRKEIKEITDKLTKNPNPTQAKRLTGELNFVYSYHFTFSGTAFRLAYVINEKKKAVTIFMVAPRENFYKVLQRKLN